MHYTNPMGAFLKASAICSFLGAITTALLMFLPVPSAPDFESRTLLFENTLYLSKLWILFIHPQVNFLAALGIATLLVKRYPLPMIFGTFFLFVWAYSEMSQLSLLIDALNQIWRPGLIHAEGETSVQMYTTLIRAAEGISDSKYFLVIYGFGIGTLCYGLAFIRIKGWARWIGISLICIGLLSFLSFMRYYLGTDSLNGVVNWVYQRIYPVLQPLVRIALGIWILGEIKKESITWLFNRNIPPEHRQQT